VSNLSFLLKLLERIVQVRLQALLVNNDMLPASQSAYRFFHSIETTVLKIYNVLLPGLSPVFAAFNATNHDLLMLHLKHLFGLLGVVPKWFSLYLPDRSFRVVLGSSSSPVVHLLCSIRQGSVLGPRMFIMYTTDTVGECRVNFHSFVDDTCTFTYLLYNTNLQLNVSLIHFYKPLLCYPHYD